MRDWIRRIDRDRIGSKFLQLPRDFDGEGCACGDLALHRYRAAMGFCDYLANHQAEAGSLDLGRFALPLRV